MTPDQQKSNLRLALILALTALGIFVGFMAKMAWLGR